MAATHTCGLWCVLVVVLVMNSSALSANIGWTETARNTAKRLTSSVRSKLDAAGALNVERPIKIKAERLGTDAEKHLIPDATPESKVITKIVHFQRHAQGYHNLIGEMHREMNIPIDFESSDPSKNPFVRPEIVDSPLTETGRQQSQARREEASMLNPEVVIVSPLCRTIQTALISFADHRSVNIQWIAHEGCREEMGLLICNKRRSLSHIEADFPSIDFSLIENEEDILFNHKKRESPLDKSERAYKFLTEFVRARPEKEIAVVTHSAWLFNMCNAVIDCGGDEDLMSWFLTSEIRSVRLTFEG